MGKIGGMVSKQLDVKHAKNDFTIMSILLLLAAVGLDVAFGQIAAFLHLPIYIDAIGTILAGMLGGPWIGLLAGVLGSVVNGFFNTRFFVFLVVSAAVGFVCGFLAKKRMFSILWKIILSTLLLTFVGILLGTPIAIIAYGGASGTGASYLTSLLRTTGQNLLEAVLNSQIFTELLDKGISVAAAYLIIKLVSPHIVTKFPCGAQFVRIIEKTAAKKEAEKTKGHKD